MKIHVYIIWHWVTQEVYISDLKICKRCYEEAYLKENIVHVYDHWHWSQLHVKRPTNTLYIMWHMYLFWGCYVQQLKRRCIRKKHEESTDGRTDNWPNLVNYWCLFSYRKSGYNMISLWAIAKGNTLGATEVIDKNNLSHVTRYYKFRHWHLMKIKYQFFTSVKIWYQYFTSVKNWYKFFTYVSIWYWFFPFVKIEYQFFTGVKNWYQFFTFVKIEYQFFTSEKNRSSPSQMARMRTNSSQLKMIKMWNLSTDVRPPKLSKLTIRKFHISKSEELVPILHTVWNLRNVKFAVQHNTFVL